MNAALIHPPLTQTFTAYGHSYRALGDNRWHVEGHGEKTSADLYAFLATARLDAAIATRYAARDAYLATGTQSALDALNAAVKAQDAASAALAQLGR